jgi:Ribonuclease G/E
MLVVQTTTFAEREKATPAGMKLLFKSRYCLVTPDAPGQNISKSIRDEERIADLRAIAAEAVSGSAIGLIVRSSAADADDAAIRDDIRATAELANRILAEPRRGDPDCLLDGPDAATLGWRDWPAPDITDADPGSFARHGIVDAIAVARTTRVGVGSGASFFVEPTRALTAVDVNTGGDTSVAAGMKANIAAIRALPRALRVRGLGGQIVLDLAPFPKRDRTQLEQMARSAFRADPIETSLVGWTPLGHLELQRKRERLPLSECLPENVS